MRNLHGILKIRPNAGLTPYVANQLQLSFRKNVLEEKKWPPECLIAQDARVKGVLEEIGYVEEDGEELKRCEEGVCRCEDGLGEGELVEVEGNDTENAGNRVGDGGGQGAAGYTEQDLEGREFGQVPAQDY